MIGFTKIIGGAPSSVAELGKHLWNQTLPHSEAKAAAYYQRGMDSGMAEAKAEGFAPVVRPDMHPRVATGLGIDVTKPLTLDQVNALIAGRRADGKPIVGKTYAKVRDRGKDPKTGEDRSSTPIGSYDFCPSPGRSIGVAWAFASPAERALIDEARLSASREAVAYIAEKIGVAHVSAGGDTKFVPGDVGWTEFTHYAARRTQISTSDGITKVTSDDTVAGDPDPHTHFLIPNAVFCPDGRVGSLHTGMIEGFIFEADGFFQARLAHKLRASGFEVDEVDGAAHMPVVPRSMEKLFSKRSNKAEILARQQASAKGVDWDLLPAQQQTLWIRKAAEGFDKYDKGGKDDVADVASWKAQAKEAGWEPPQSFLFQGPKLPELTEEEKHRLSYENALKFVEKKFEHSSVIKHWSLREAANRGSIPYGFDGVADTNAITQRMREDGIRQYGETTPILWGHEEGRRYVSVTTGLHEDQEKEFIRLAQKLSADKSNVVPRAFLDKHIALSGLTFDGEHGKAQKELIYRSGSAGRFHLGLAAAGAGKTTAWIPLVAAKREMGGRVYGASLAWEQADDLVKAGIERQNVKAYSVLIDEIATLKLGPGDLVAVDEWALLGTRQGLQLLRLANHYGFEVTSLGDPKQCASVEAGNIVNLVKRGLPDQVFEIETTRRQETDREKKFVGLLRNGEAKQALDMKREDGLAEMVPGDSAKLVARTADLYMSWLKETGIAPSVAAPTNHDAHTISLAIRAKRQAEGLVEPDVKIIKAGDNRGHQFGLALSPGDRVRLFKSTGARFTNGKGGNIGRNRSSLDVLTVNQDGIMARSVKTGSVGFVAWESLIATRGPSKGRVLLDYAYCKTINSAQGSDSNDHILALPNGSQAINGLSGYSGGTRHKKRIAILTSDVAERLAIVKRRPLNDPRVIDLDSKWANVARNLAYMPEKDLAVAMLDRVESLRRGTVGRFQTVMKAAEVKNAPSAGPSAVVEHQAQAVQNIGSLDSGTAKRVADIVSEIIIAAPPAEEDWRKSLPQEPPTPEETAVARYAALIAGDRMGYNEALDALLSRYIRKDGDIDKIDAVEDRYSKMLAEAAGVAVEGGTRAEIQAAMQKAQQDAAWAKLAPTSRDDVHRHGETQNYSHTQGV